MDPYQDVLFCIMNYFASTQLKYRHRIQDIPGFAEIDATSSNRPKRSTGSDFTGCMEGCGVPIPTSNKSNIF